MVDLENQIVLRVSKEMKRRISEIARKYDVSEGSVVRTAISDYLESLKELNSVNNQKNSISNLTEIENIFTDCINRSNTWEELQANLKNYNLGLIAKGGGLSIIKLDNEKTICKASEAGFGYSKLIRKFRAGYPGHSHTWLEERIMTE